MNKQSSTQDSVIQAGGQHGLLLALGGGLVAALAAGLLFMAWSLGGPRPTTWVEQSIDPSGPPAAGAQQGPATGTKPGTPS